MSTSVQGGFNVSSGVRSSSFFLFCKKVRRGTHGNEVAVAVNNNRELHGGGGDVS